jgi:hypothetical protein
MRSPRAHRPMKTGKPGFAKKNLRNLRLHLRKSADNSLLLVQQRGPQ